MTASRTPWLGLVLPTFFGIVAGVIYYQALATRLQPVAFVQILESVELGKPISSEHLGRVLLTGDTERLARGALLWSHVGEILGQNVNRRMRVGQIVLKSDFDHEDQTAEARDGEQAAQISGLNKVECDPNIRVGSTFRALVIDPKVDNDRGEYIGPFRVLQISRDAKDNRISEMKIATKSRNNRPDPELGKLVRAINSRDALYVSFSRMLTN